MPDSKKTVPDYNAMDDGAFRRDVRTFFEAEYPPHLRNILRRARWAEMKEWWGKLYAKGWAAPGWPREWGGMALDAAKMLIFVEELERLGIARPPDQGITQVGPILMRYGTAEQKAHYLLRSLSGEYIWCQGYSEPNAGSDLASLQTSAVIDGDDLVINGQKIWTSLAQDATHIYVLVRTDKAALRKQLGISMVLAAVTTPGITIRPIRNIAGHAEFCEVFFDNVRVPRANLVGKLHEGWTIAKALLSYERLSIGSPRRPAYALRRIELIARAKGLFADSGFTDRYNELHLDIQDLGSLYGRFVGQLKRGESLGADISMLKIWTTETWQRLNDMLLEISAEDGVVAGVREIDGIDADILSSYYYARPGTIVGGTSEVQRNLLARYVLRLPAS